ncbi:MAG: glycosyltransferase family 4 protein [Gammaproteobacteria bacterium]|nr:glycosyltransferase family 4 protein [Gammaproteobacteria bacterium]
MKVVLFSRYPRSFDLPKGGVESVTVILARALARMADLNVHLITLEKELVEGMSETDDKVTIHRLAASTWPQILDIHAGPGRRRLLTKIRQLKPDVVHSHETFGLTMGDLEIPHVFTLHGFDHANIPAEGRSFAQIRSILWRYVESRGLGRQKTIISISPYVRGMIEQYAPQAAIHDIDNPVDDRYFTVPPEKQIEGDKRVLILGWINERKNTLGAIRAIAHAIRSGAKGTLVVAGEAKLSSYKELLLREIRDLGIDKHVEFLGHINREQLENELRRTTILLLPSLQENAPMAISEAMAASIPVVTSNRCGIPYMVADGESGFLVDPTDSIQIGERLKELLLSPELCRKMGTRGREIALARFHSDAVAAKTRAIYESALHK